MKASVAFVLKAVLSSPLMKHSQLMAIDHDDRPGLPKSQASAFAMAGYERAWTGLSKMRVEANEARAAGAPHPWADKIGLKPNRSATSIAPPPEAAPGASGPRYEPS